MSIHRTFLATLAAATVAACTEAATPVAPDALLSHGAGHRVVGSGHVVDDAGQREFTFHAVESPTGEVSGSFKVVLANGLFLEADVECLAVEGDTGWVSGRIRDTNAGFLQIGSGSMFYAIDAGEGAGSVDQVSLAALNMPEETILGFCEERPLILPTLTVTDGNVQVR